MSDLNFLETLQTKRQEAQGEVAKIDACIAAYKSGEAKAPKRGRPAGSKGKKSTKPAELAAGVKIEDGPNDIKVKVFPDIGKGRKQCKKCDRIVGARTPICVCGWDFQTGEQTKVSGKRATGKRAAKKTDAKSADGKYSDMKLGEAIKTALGRRKKRGFTLSGLAEELLKGGYPAKDPAKFVQTVKFNLGKLSKAKVVVQEKDNWMLKAA